MTPLEVAGVWGLLFAWCAVPWATLVLGCAVVAYELQHDRRAMQLRLEHWMEVEHQAIQDRPVVGTLLLGHGYVWALVGQSVFWPLWLDIRLSAYDVTR